MQSHAITWSLFNTKNVIIWAFSLRGVLWDIYDSKQYPCTQKISSLAQKLTILGLKNFMGNMLILGTPFQPLCTAMTRINILSLLGPFPNMLCEKLSVHTVLGWGWLIPNVKSSYLHTSIQVSLTFKASFSYCLILEDCQTYFQLVPNLFKGQGCTIWITYQRICC